MKIGGSDASWSSEHSLSLGAQVTQASERTTLGAFELIEALEASDDRMLWRARHLESGTAAAVKILTGTLDDSRIQALEREVRSQARLQHPAVVRLFDYGMVGERCATQIVDQLASLESSDLQAEHPYLAMEWASQGSLWDSLPLESWEEIRHILTRVLRALAYAHARDVVHRDLKPENILVFGREQRSGSGDRPVCKIGDFGLAHASGIEDELDHEALGSVSGTPGYLPPEQARGEWRAFGPWTDVYAVGCLAWRLVCRSLPFSGESSFGVILKHVDAPRPALEPAITVPAALEDWIHCAMAIDPSDRFQSAASALSALPGGRRTGVEPTTSDGDTVGPAMRWPADWRTIDSPDASVAPERRDMDVEGLELFGLREVPLVGRADERDTLWRLLGEVVEDGGIRVVELEGDAGVGKSRLTEWLVRLASEIGVAQPLRVLNSKGRQGPSEGLKGMLRREFSCWELRRRELRERLISQLPALETPELTVVETPGRDGQRRRDADALAKWLEPAGDKQDRLEAEPAFSGEKQHRRLLARILRRLSVSRPTILWLDDVPWDGESMDVVESFEGGRREEPDMLVVATGRTDEFADNPTVRHRLEGFRARYGGERIELAPLERTQQRRLVQSMLPLEFSLVDRLIERTEGNPLFAVQLLRHWVDQGYVQSGDRGFHIVDERRENLPADLVELWEGRIRRLEELAPTDGDNWVRQVLELAAAQGRNVDPDLWERSCELAGLETPSQFISQLVARGMALENERGWEFAHGLLVESLEKAAREAGRWASHHRAIADVLADKPDRGDGRLEARRAEHLLQAGDQEAALDPLIVAARRRGLLGNLTERYEALTRRQALLDELGIGEGDRRRVENETHLSAHLVAEERHREARTIARRACRRATENEWHDIRARTLKTLSECAKDDGNYAESAELLDEAIDAGMAADEMRLVAALYADIGWLALIRGESGRAREQLELCRKHAEQADARYWMVNAKYQLGQVELSTGDSEAARACFEEALSAARRCGFQRLEAICINSLGDLAKERGDIEEALTRFDRYNQLAEIIQLDRLSLLARLNMAQVRAVDGDTHEADHLLQSASKQLADAQITDHEGLIDIIRLVVAVQRRDIGSIASLVSTYGEAWPENQRLDHDVPWLLEQAFRVAVEDWPVIGDADRGDQRERRLVERIGRRSRELYAKLGDAASANRIGELVEAAFPSN